MTNPWNEFGTFVGLTQDMIEGIQEIKNESFTPALSEGDWYDLSGRKIVNGKLPKGPISSVIQTERVKRSGLSERRTIVEHLLHSTIKISI